MKNLDVMKRLMVLVFVMMATVSFAQNKEEKAVCTRYENGEMKETGLLKADKLHGQWVKYSESGDAIIVGNYKEGKKVGEWLFVNENTGSIVEVNFNNNKVISTKRFILESPTSIVTYKR